MDNPFICVCVCAVITACLNLCPPCWHSNARRGKCFSGKPENWITSRSTLQMHACACKYDSDSRCIASLLVYILLWFVSTQSFLHLYMLENGTLIAFVCVFIRMWLFNPVLLYTGSNPAGDVDFIPSELQTVHLVTYTYYALIGQVYRPEQVPWPISIFCTVVIGGISKHREEGCSDTVVLVPGWVICAEGLKLFFCCVI